MANDSDSKTIRFGRLMDEFVERFRQGERPSLTEYVSQHPDLEDDIRELFPALAMMEQAGDLDQSTDPQEGKVTADGNVPQQLGDYRIIREVGRGGMGVVYEAEQESLGRHVALKILPFYALMDPKHLQRFQREARAAAQLHHTNIVPVFGVGQHEDVHYYAMQFIRGLGLDEVLDELRLIRTDHCQLTGELSGETQREPFSRAHSTAGALLSGEYSVDGSAADKSSVTAAPIDDPSLENKAAFADNSSSVTLPGQDKSSTSTNDHQYFRSVARLGIQVADALGYAHGQGVLHRDVKPSNLLLDTHGTVWVTDFGLAKTNGEDITHTGDFVGTLRYMAPERFRGWSDPRSDVYSLGLTLYEMLTLGPAFSSTDRVELVRCITQEDPPRPRRLDRSIPRDLETIVLKAIGKEPQSRYQTASDLSNDLQRFLADRPIVARRTSATERTLRWCRRNPLVTSLVAAVAVLLVVLTIGSWVAAFRLSERHKEVVEHLGRATIAERNEREARQQATRHLYDAYLARARAGRLSGRAGRRFASLEALANAAELIPTLNLGKDARLELRNQAIACMALVDLRVDKVWPDDGPYNSAHRRWAFDSTVERYAKLDVEAEVVVYRMSDNSELMRLGGDWYEDADYCPLLSFSPDDRFLGARGYNTDASLRVRVWNLENKKLVFDEPSGGQDYENTLAFRPDSSQLAYVNPDAELVIFDIETGAATPLIKLDRPAYFVVFSPSGDRIALSHHAGEISVIDAKTGDETANLSLPDHVPHVSWSDDGKLLSAACNDMNVYVWDTEDLTLPPRIGEGHLSKSRHVALSADDLLMSTGWDQTTRLWDPFHGDELVRVDLRGSRFSNDGRWLAFEQSGVRVGRCEVADARECRHMYSKTSNDNVVDIQFSKDGKHIAAVGRSDGISVWHVASRDRLVNINPYPEARTATFTPDGQYLISSGSGGADRWPTDAVLQQNEAELLSQRENIGYGSIDIPSEVALSQDGSRLVGSFAHDIVDVYSPDSPEDYVRMAGPAHVWFVAISPDARWVAAAGKTSYDVLVWNAQTGERELTRSSASEGALVSFSPDSRWFVVSIASEFVFYEVGSWRELHRLPGERPCIGRIAFSPDMKSVAIGRQREVKLYDTATFDELATFGGPQQEQITTTYPEGAGDICFSPNGDFLAIGTMQGAIQLWDIRRIRSRLARMQLDWEHSPTANQSSDE